MVNRMPANAPLAALVLIALVVSFLAYALLKALRYRAWEIADLQDGEFPPPVLMPRAREPAHPPRAKLGGAVAEPAAARAPAHRQMKNSRRARDSLDPGPNAA